MAVDGREFTARRAVVLATGTTPSVPPIPGLEDVAYWTNREAIEAAELPESLIVLGGGAIGVELAQVFARFGVQVTVLEAAPRLLPGEEPEASELVQTALAADGVQVRLGVQVDKVRPDGTQIAVTVDGHELLADRLLVAIGRRADLDALGLPAAGVSASRYVPVDERLRVTDRIWAVGDLTGHGAFTHVGMYQADIAVRDLLGRPGPAADYRTLPRVTFTTRRSARSG